MTPWNFRPPRDSDKETTLLWELQGKWRVASFPYSSDRRWRRFWLPIWKKTGRIHCRPAKTVVKIQGLKIKRWTRRYCTASERLCEERELSHPWSGIDRGKWFAAKVLQENSDVKTNSGTISLPSIPSNGWRVFPSQNIPSLFNNGHVHYYASF